MNVSRIFIERPVMTALVTFAILLFGIVGYRSLPVAALPSVDLPDHSGEREPCRAPRPETMASAVATRSGAPVFHHRRRRFDELLQLAREHHDHHPVHAGT